MNKLSVLIIIAVVLLLSFFASMAKRAVCQRSYRNTIEAEREAMLGPKGMTPEPELPKIDENTDTQTMIDFIQHAQPQTNHGSLIYYRAEKALRILCDRKEPQSLEMILDYVKNNPSSPLCDEVIDILEKRWRDERAVVSLTCAANNGRRKAVKALGSYLPESRDSLIALMQHADAEIRFEAALCLRYTNGGNSIYRGINDPTVMDAVTHAMNSGSEEVAMVYWRDFLGPTYKNVIMEAFEHHPMSTSFGDLRSTIYIHHTMMTEKEFIIGTPDVDLLRKRLERLLDDPEHYNFKP